MMLRLAIALDTAVVASTPIAAITTVPPATMRT
jgi:hypothetical protein